MGSQLGAAVLDLTADQSEFDRILDAAKAKAAAAAAEMERMLHIKITADLGEFSRLRGGLLSNAMAMLNAEEQRLTSNRVRRVGMLAQAEEMAARRVASTLGDSRSSSTTGGGSDRSTVMMGGGQRIWGVRGPDAPGSRMNPLVVVLEAANRTPLGALGAAIGDDSSGGGSRSTMAAGSRESSGGSGGLLAGLLAGGAGRGGGIRNVLWGKGGGHGGPWGLRLLLGGGALAGAGTLGSFAGFGAEHALFTALGLAGSAASATAGGALVGLGALGQMAVGGGSDMAVMKSTISETKELSTAYQKAQKAVAVYGAGSKQAAEAQRELNVLMAELGNTAAVKAEMGLAKSESALGEFWRKETVNARVQAVNILSQVLHLAHDYVPRVARAAEENLKIINRDIKPLFAWLEGPEGIGVWNALEARFKENLPFAVGAFDQAVEFLLKTIKNASQYTGGFTQALDRFFTKWNSPEYFARWEGTIKKLVGDFHTWMTFVKLLGEDIFDLFRNDAKTGEGIIKTISGMLLKLREWEQSSAGAASLKSIFAVHREEVIDLLKVLPPLIKTLEPIYMTIAPPLVRAVTKVAEAFAFLIEKFDALGSGATWLTGLTLIGLKLGKLEWALKGIAGAFGLVGKTSREAAAGASGSAAAGDVSLLSRLKGMGTGLRAALIRGAVGAGAGYFVGSSVSTATGATGTLSDALKLGGAGAGLGFMVGGPVGAGVGAAIGAATPYAVKFLSSVFSSHAPDYGRKLAHGMMSTFGPVLSATTRHEMEHGLAASMNHIRALRARIGEPTVSHAGTIGVEVHLASNGRINKERRELVAAAERAGREAASKFQQAYNAIPVPSTFGFLQDARKYLASMDPMMRNAAAKQMVAYAGELEKQGKLPAGAMRQVLKSLEVQLPQLQQYLLQAAGKGMGSFADVLAESKIKLGMTLKDVVAEFGLVGVNPSANGQELVSTWKLAMGELEHMAKTSPPQFKSLFLRAMEELRHDGSQYAEGLSISFTKMRVSIEHDASKLAKELPRIGEQGFKAYENDVAKMEKLLNERSAAGTRTFGQGLELINKMLETELRQLGMPHSMSKALVTGVNETNFKSEPTPFSHHAVGGLVQIGRPGEAGHDSVPLNVGGQPIVVAPGEQVAVFNRHQLPIVNAALAPMGGLEGLFSTVNTPHYMATGGMVGKMIATANRINAAHYPYVWGGGHNPTFAGPYDCSGAVSAVLHAGGYLPRPEVSGELMNFGAPGPGNVTIYASPKHTFMSILGRFFGTHGASGAGWYAGSPVPGYAVRHVVGAGGLGSIATPKVSGSGALATLARAGLHDVARAANAYMSSHLSNGMTGGSSEAHGAYGRSQLEVLWRQAGGPANMAHVMAAIALAESDGNPQARNASGASGLWQILGLPFPGNVFSPLTNARMAVAKYKSQGLGAWVTYTSGAYRRFMNSGGLLSAFAKGGLVGFSRGTPNAHRAAKPRFVKPRGVRHAKRPVKAKALSQGHLTMNMAQLIGWPAKTGTENSYNVLVKEQELLSEMTTNPASILKADMSLLGPTLAQGETISPGMLVPQAEHVLQRLLQKEGETPELGLQGQLLQYIGGLDDHRLLSGPDIGVLAKDFKWGIPFKAGYPVFKGELSVLEGQRQLLKAVIREHKSELADAVKAIARRRRRELAIRHLQKVAYARYRHLKTQLERLKTASLKNRLHYAQDRYAQLQRVHDAKEHERALTLAITAERALPKGERNERLIGQWEVERAKVSSSIQAMTVPSSKGITDARVSLLRDALEKQLHPIEGSLRALGGSSTGMGHGGELGRVMAQIKALESGRRELSLTTSEEQGTALPRLELNISQLSESLKEAAESVPPAMMPGAGSGESLNELNSLLKAQNEQLAQQLAVSQEQYKVLAAWSPSLPPYAGKFHTGGVVPGPLGAERMALVQAGERISPIGERDRPVHIHVHVEDDAVDRKKIRTVIHEETRGMSRSAGRPLPSLGGGGLA